MRFATSLLVLFSLDVTAQAQVELFGVSRADRTLHRISTAGAELVGNLDPLPGGADLAALVLAGDGLAYTVDRASNRLITLRLSDAHVVATVALD